MSLKTAPKIADVDPDWIDIGTIREWILICENDHGEKCARPISLFAGSAGPRLLIDVDQGCLVHAKPEYTYAALSYVWGRTEVLKTTRDNLALLLEKESISAQADLLPRTIRDTMGLVRVLGLRYLWVDCLCIVQDNLDSKHNELQNMANIYAQAFVTVIAANGWDAEHGLRGIREVKSQSRNLSSMSLKYDFYESMQPHSSIWYSRGWTFQELIFARRKLMFHYKVVLWECSCATWHEATGLGPMPRLPGQLTNSGSQFTMGRWGRDVVFGDWPNIRLYIDMVCEYNARQLTLSEDGLNAISGLISFWNKSFDGGFIWGLPQMFFHQALLWQPLEHLVRRADPHEASSKSEVLPSWSWVGWQGTIDGSEWKSKFDHVFLLGQMGAQE